MRLSRKVRNLLLLSVAAASLGAFIYLSSEVREASQGLPELIGELDTRIGDGATHLRNRQMVKSAIAITELGSATVLTLVIVVAAIFFGLRRQYRSIALLVASGVTASVLSSVLKSHFERPRPNPLLHLVQADGFSFPSGHTLAATAIYMTLAILTTQEMASKPHRYSTVVIATLLILAISVSRIRYQPAHQCDHALWLKIVHKLMHTVEQPV
jgi:undecaprenyl-diphosphatase